MAVISTLAIALLGQAAILASTPLGLSGDEAYYWQWSKQLDLSYYEKGPGIALLIACGRKLFGDTALGIRAGALFCQLLIGTFLYLFISRSYSIASGVTVLACYWSTLAFGTLGLFMTGDPGLCLFWLISISAAAVAVRKDQPAWWLVSFGAIGVGALFKFTALILLPAFGLYLLMTPERRRHLRSPLFWLGVVAASTAILPVVIWNADHGWVNFAENARHLTSNKSVKLSHVAELVFGQWGLVGVLLFPCMLLLVGRSVRHWRQQDLVARLYIVTIVPLALLCLALSFTRAVYANWPMPLLLGGLLLIAHHFGEGAFRIFGSRIPVAAVLLPNYLLLFAAHLLFTGATFGLPPNMLPTKMLVGWKEVGKTAESLLQAGLHCAHTDIQPFLVSETYRNGAETGFYARSHPTVLVTDPDEPRFTQFDVWDEWAAMRHRNALLVFSSPAESKDFQHAFASIQPAAIPSIRIDYGHKTIRQLFFFEACSYNGSDLATHDAKSAAHTG